MEFHWAFAMFQRRCAHKIADSWVSVKCWKHKYILFNLFVEMKTEMQTIN